MKHKIDIKIKRIVAMTLTMLMLCATVSQGLSENTTPKEEVVYGKLAQDGAVRELYVVNAFEVSKDTAILDYGKYGVLRNMTTKEKLTDIDGAVSIQIQKGKFYYQGNLKSKELPWIIQIDYLLDGRSISPDKLAGESGKLIIDISIKQNRSIDPDFFKNFTLQISLKLDGEKCTDIASAGSTIASSGEDKVVTYIIMPGKEKQLSLSANVKNFTMEGIQFNGIPLALMIEAPDTTEMTNGFVELKDGIIKLDDGTKELLDGSIELNDGALELKEGAVDLKDGVQKLLDGLIEFSDGTGDLNQGVIDLSDGVDELADGSADMRSGLRKLSNKSEELSDGTTTAGTGISRLAGGMGTLADSTDETVSGAAQLTSSSAIFRDGLSGLQVGTATLASSLAELKNSLTAVDTTAENAAAALLTTTDPAIQALIDGYTKKNAEVEAAKAFLSQLTPAATTIADHVKSLSDGYEAFDQGLSQLYQGLMRQQEAIRLLSAGLSSLDGEFSALSDGVILYTGGVTDAYEGYKELHDGILDLKEGTTKLKDGSVELQDGSVELLDGTTELNTGTIDLVDGTIKLYDGTSELKDGVVDMQDGTSEMKDKTSIIDSDVQKEIDQMMAEYKNEDFVPKSFVSTNNTNVLAVQFVLQTDKIDVPDLSDIATEDNVEQTLWQRISAIFKMIAVSLQSVISHFSE